MTDDRWRAYLHFIDEQAAAAGRSEDRDRQAQTRKDAQSAQRARDAMPDPDVS